MRLRGFRWVIATLLTAAGVVLHSHGQTPFIVTQPSSQAVPTGGSATLSVAAIVIHGPANPLPLSYQWRHAGTNLPNSIVRFAGGALGENAAATSASLGNPSAVAVDSSGNLFIADSFNSIIAKVDTSGVLTIVAGRYPSSVGFTGDGGPAAQATLNQPSGLTLDAFGNLFIADTLNHAIRKVSAHGTITTVAGNGSSGYSGDGGPATSAGLSGPTGVSVDSSGNLFIADRENQVIRRVAPTGTITTVVGLGPDFGGFSGDGGPATSAKLRSPTGVAVDASGNLLIADYGNSVVRKVDTNSVISTLAGICFETFPQPGYTGDGGAAASATLYHPAAVAVDTHGNLFIADSFIHVIRQVDANGNISTVAGNGVQGYSGDGGAATSATLNGPVGLALSSQGHIYIAEPYNSVIRRVNPSGVITTFAGNGSATKSGDSGASTHATLSGANGVALDPTGNLFISDTYNHSIRSAKTSGIISTIAGTGTQGYSGDGGPATSATLNGPAGIATDASGNLFIADAYNHAIRKVSTLGTITTVAGNGIAAFLGDGGAATSASLNNPSGVVVDASGNLFIADTYNHSIRMVDALGTITTVAGKGKAGYSGDGGAATNATLNTPSGVALDANGNLFIADTLNHSIRKVDLAGNISSFAGMGPSLPGYTGDGGPAGNATLQSPVSVAVDSNGNLLIADFGNNVSRQVSPSGTISTIAGNGEPGYSGDGGPASAAKLFGPSAIVADTFGNVFIADANNAMVRKVTVFGATLSLPAVSSEDVGNYEVVVSTAASSVTSKTVSVSISVNPSAPIAIADALDRPDDTLVVNVPLTTLMANDHDPASRTLSITAVGNAKPAGATVVILEGFALYSVPSDTAGDGSFNYTLSNGTLTAIGTVTITQTSATTVPSGPTSVSINAVGADFVLKFLGVPGLTYRIQYTTNPSSLYTWNEFSPPAVVNAPANGVFSFTDVAPTDSLRLYRTVLRP